MDFHCSMCKKLLAPEDDYVCISNDAVVCLEHIHQPKKLMVYTVQGLTPFVLPDKTPKSTPRPWQEQLWLAPFEPSRDRHQ